MELICSRASIWHDLHDSFVIIYQHGSEQHYLEYQQNIEIIQKNGSVTFDHVTEFINLCIKIFKNRGNRFFFNQYRVDRFINMFQVMSVRIGNDFTVL